MLSEEEQELWKRHGSKNTQFKKILLKIIRHKIKELKKVDINEENWAVKRAYYDGTVSALEDLLTLIPE